jgi:amino acid transporter
MKALSLIAMVFAAFLIFLGLSSRQTAGNVLSNAIIIGGAIIAAFVVIVWIIMFFKEKKNSDKDSDF